MNREASFGRPPSFFSAGPGFLLLAAAAGDQISNTYQEKGHGLFTYFLLKGIREQAGRRDVDFKAAFDYAAPKVANTARREFNADQTPQWKGRP